MDNSEPIAHASEGVVVDDHAMHLVCKEPGGLTRSTRLGCILLAALCFFVLYLISWRMMQTCWRRFRSYTDSVKADNASRLNSTVHSIIVAPSLLWGLAHTSWGPAYQPTSDPSFLQSVLTISMGYFLCDLYILLTYHTPMWQVFVLHHVMALVPYLLYYFTDCTCGLYVLTCYMLVEFTNMFYNFKLWMEDCGLNRTRLYAALLYATIAGWLVFRMANPAWCVVCSHKYVLPTITAGWECVIPSLICGYFVNVFCFAAFNVVLVKEVYDRWTKPIPGPKPIVEMKED